MRGRRQSPETRAKISAAQKGRKLSPEHRAAQSRGQIERYRRAREREVDQPIEKRCTKCKKMKRIPDDYVMRKRTLATGEVRYYAAGECKKCGRKRAAKWREKMKAEGKMTEIDRRHKRAYIERDPERYRRIQRESAAAARRRAGVPEKGPWMKYRDKPRSDLLPIEPIQKFLIEYFDKPHPPTIEQLSANSGVSVERIRRIITGEEPGQGELKTVTTPIIDKILLGADAQEMFHELYPVD